MKVISAILSIALLGGGGYFGFTRFARPFFGGASKQAGNMPSARPGALTEFPVDTDPKAPAKPVEVSTVPLRGPRQGVPPVKGLPPGVTAGTFRGGASTITSATYQTAPADPPVNVHVVETPSPDSLQASIADEAIQAAGGAAENTGVQVTSPNGQVYRGRKIRTGIGSVIYILSKVGATMLILIYSPQAGGAQTAERLASNIGNGAGLYDYADVPGAVALLPALAPPGFTPGPTASYAATDLVSIEELKRQLGAQAQDVQKYIPDRIFTATYYDQTNRPWKVAAGQYDGMGRAWMAWSALRWTSGLSGLESVNVADGDGLTAVQQGSRYLISRSGSRLILVVAPGAEDVQRSVLLMQSLQF